MLYGKTIEAPDGLKGFDANTVVSPRDAALFHQYGYRFAVRYVRRTQHHDFDITEREAQGILNAGLGLMLVQHVAGEDPGKNGWTPNGAKGSEYGLTAAIEAANAGYPSGQIVWLDLEGVATNVPPAEVVLYCNNWFDQVKAHGYEPGLYVGYGAGLNADWLYRKLRFSRYWSAYNLNADSVPAVRGVQMKQGAYPGRGAVPGVSYQFDTDVCRADQKGGRVKMLVDTEWSP